MDLIINGLCLRFLSFIVGIGISTRYYTVESPQIESIVTQSLKTTFSVQFVLDFVHHKLECSKVRTVGLST